MKVLAFVVIERGRQNHRDGCDVKRKQNGGDKYREETDSRAAEDELTITDPLGGSQCWNDSGDLLFGRLACKRTKRQATRR